MVLADEINRTPPKTQAALLEAMQEHRVTVQGKTYALDQPFFVFATQNPIELEGTYPLPEAQLDRFLLKIVIGYPAADAERAAEVYREMIGERQADLLIGPFGSAATLMAGAEAERARREARWSEAGVLPVAYTRVVYEELDFDAPEPVVAWSRSGWVPSESRMVSAPHFLARRSVSCS